MCLFQILRQNQENNFLKYIDSFIETIDGAICH